MLVRLLVKIHKAHYFYKLSDLKSIAERKVIAPNPFNFSFSTNKCIAKRKHSLDSLDDLTSL